jgi:hypothetical protein
MTMRVLVLVMSAMLAGCASGPKYAEIERSIPALQPEMGRIFFYRDSAIGAMIKPEILLNGQVVGEMVPLGFFYVDRAPGTYLASAKTESETTVQVPLEANQTRYVRGSISLGILVGRPNLLLVDGVQGLQDVRELSYVGNVSALAGGSPPAAPASAATGAGDGKLKDLEGLLPAGRSK